jgi:hypothetical protein
MGDISHIDEERERREKEKWQMDPEIQRAEREFTDWGDRLREQFGKWDFCDPAATAILRLVEAQNKLADAISEYAAGISAGAPPIDEALERRIKAAMALLNALLLETPFEWTPQGHRFQEEESRRRNSSE